MSKSNLIAQDIDHLYVNLSQYNNSPNRFITASITQNFNEPIIANPSEYHCFVSKMFIPTNSVPLTDFKAYLQNPVEPIPLNPPTILSITFKYGASLYQAYVNYNDNYVIGSSSTESRFYVYSFLQFNDMLYLAFKACYQALIAAHPGIVPAQPVMIFEPNTKLFSYQAPREYTTDPTSPYYTGVEVWVNDVFYSFVNTLLYQSYDNTDGVNGLMNYQLLTRQLFGNTGDNTVVHNGITYYINTQEFNSLDTFSSVRSIVVVSDLPIVPEYINASSNNVQNETIQLSILTEVSIDYQAPDNVIYIPQAEYRLSNMSSSSPLRSINLQFYWLSKQGGLFPIQLFEKDGITVKLGFRKKTFENAMLYALQAMQGKERDEAYKAIVGGKMVQ